MKKCLTIFGVTCIALLMETAAVCSAETGNPGGSNLKLNAGVQQAQEKVHGSIEQKTGEVRVISQSQLETIPSPSPENPIEKYQGSILTVKPDASKTLPMQTIKPNPNVDYTMRVVGKVLQDNPDDVSQKAGKSEPKPQKIPAGNWQAPNSGK